MQQDKLCFIRGLHNLRPPARGSVVTIGSFDGVHLGHQVILKQVTEHARLNNLASVVMTFEPHPREFFSREQAPTRLMRLRDKIEVLPEYGISHLCCLRFNEALRSLSAQQFIDLVLVAGLGVKHLIVGDDFRFGSDRIGDFRLLQEAGLRQGFTVQDTATIAARGERISSTLIREVVARSDFAEAERLLGRPFAVNGRVIYGQQLGAQLGFPTANVQLKRYRAPLSGVFAVEVALDGQIYQGAANVGVRPTVGDLVKPILEVHLLDFQGNLYGQRISVVFRHKIRDEARFATLDELVENIHSDIEKIRAWFARLD